MSDRANDYISGGLTNKPQYAQETTALSLAQIAEKLGVQQVTKARIAHPAQYVIDGHEQIDQAELDRRLAAS